MKIVFFGSSEFSLPALQACRKTPHQLLQIITTPAKRQGRGLQEIPNPVEVLAANSNLPVQAPADLKSPDLLREIKNLAPDFFVVASYGKMIPSDWLKIPSKAALNVHPSLLPKYRGAAPLHWPILNGEPETGLSIAEVTDKLDAGDIFYQKRITLSPDVTSLDLEKNLSELSPEALQECFEQFAAGRIIRTMQKESDSSYARKLTKEDGQIRWEESAAMISRKVRGLTPWPGTFFTFQNTLVQILQARIIAHAESKSKPGTILSMDRKASGFEIQTGDGTLMLLRVKPAGKREMSALDFINGNRLKASDQLQP